MGHNPALLIELKDKQPRELLAIILALAAAQPLRDLVHVLTGADALVEAARAFVLRLPDRPPSHDQLFRPRGGLRKRGVREPGALDHTLGEYLKLDIPDERYAAPCYRRGPEGSGVGNTSGDGGEVWVRGGEEVEGYLG